MITKRASIIAAGFNAGMTGAKYMKQAPLSEKKKLLGLVNGLANKHSKLNSQVLLAKDPGVNSKLTSELIQTMVDNI